MQLMRRLGIASIASPNFTRLPPQIVRRRQKAAEKDLAIAANPLNIKLAVRFSLERDV